MDKDELLWEWIGKFMELNKRKPNELEVENFINSLTKPKKNNG